MFENDFFSNTFPFSQVHSMRVYGNDTGRNSREPKFSSSFWMTKLSIFSEVTSVLVSTIVFLKSSSTQLEFED